jgi:hypothetical protein
VHLAVLRGDAIWLSWRDRDGNPEETTKTGLLFYDGMSWAALALPKGLGVVDLWGDERSVVWAILADPTRASLDELPAGPFALARHDGTGWLFVDTPSSFRATRAVGCSPRSVWFVGDEQAFQWDGNQLRRVELPLLSVKDAACTGGDLWVVGGSHDVPLAVRLVAEGPGGAP